MASEFGTRGAAGIVRDQVARGDRVRRARVTMRTIVRLAPWGAFAALALAALGRWLGWRPVLPLSILIVSAAGLGLFAVLAHRRREPSDGVAARVDRDAGLGGELRSAHWFATQGAADPWPVFHIERAAERAARISWPAVYPAVRAPRAWGATGVSAIVAVALCIHVPTRPPRSSLATVLAAASAQAGVPLPPDVAARLQDLLNKSDLTPLSAADAKALADLNDILKKLDPNADPKLAELLKRIQNAEAKKAGDKVDADLASAGEPDAMPEDMKAALDDIASRLSEAKTGAKAEGSTNVSPNSNEGQFGKASANASAKPANAFSASVQLVRETAMDKGQQMMGGGGALNGDPTAGRGGNPAGRSGAPAAMIKADTLRRELVEAHEDTPGTNVTKEDLRRKTEQGKSTLAFTHAAAASTIDRSHQSPPPAIPDGRRALVQSYFIRHQ